MMPHSKSTSASSDTLSDYNAKRDFEHSPEPPGSPRKRKAKKKTLIFCVQKHLASHLHYDFRLEHKGVLLSWAVPKGPSLNPRDKRLAMKVEDHPYDYADFEGVIPQGYGAGIVMVWDKGTWTPEPGFEDVDAALEAGELKFRLDGVKLKGSWVLIQTQTEGYPQGRTWLLIKHRDQWAGEVDVAAIAPKSVKSFGDFPEILAEEHPELPEGQQFHRGGATGKMLEEIEEKAAKIRARPKPPTRKRRASRRKAS